MNNLSNVNQISEVIVEKSKELTDLSKKILDNCRILNELDRKGEAINDNLDSLRYGLQKAILEEKCEETGKPKHSNETARKGELLVREQEHQPLQFLKQDRADHIESVKNLQALIDFQKRQFQIGQTVLQFLANQS